MLGRALLLSLSLHLLVVAHFFSFEPQALAKATSGPRLLNASLSPTLPPLRQGRGEAKVAAGLPPSTRLSSDSLMASSRKSQRSIFRRSTASTAGVSGAEPVFIRRPSLYADAKKNESGNFLEDDEAMSSDEIRGYRLSLARQARRFKDYPAIARENAWQGVVILNIYGVPGGDVPVLAMAQSSGHALLDSLAVEMMTHAVRQSSLPGSMRGKGFAITLPVHYRLDD